MSRIQVKIELEAITNIFYQAKKSPVIDRASTKSRTIISLRRSRLSQLSQ